MITFNWSITSMPTHAQKTDKSDVIFQVNWQCLAHDDKYHAVSAGAVSVNYTAGSSFTPYADLTEEQVWAWVNPKINRTTIEADLQTQINSQMNPPITTQSLPWSN